MPAGKNFRTIEDVQRASHDTGTHGYLALWRSPISIGLFHGRPMIATRRRLETHHPGRLHGFRHYFCSQSADSGTPEQMLMSWLGHRDSEMIRLYYHQRDADARRQMGRSH